MIDEASLELIGDVVLDVGFEVSTILEEDEEVDFITLVLVKLLVLLIEVEAVPSLQEFPVVEPGFLFVTVTAVTLPQFLQQGKHLVH